MPATTEYKPWAVNRQIEGIAFTLALCTEHHYTYPQGAGSGFVDTSGNRFRCDGHQYENGMIVRFAMSSGTAPAPLSANVDYYIVGVLRDGTGDWFQVSLTSGGAAIDITSGPNSGYYSWRLHRVPCTANAGTDVITATGHPYINGERVTFENVGGGLPSGIAAGSNYYVVGAVPRVSFQISATKGGAALDITGAGSGFNFVYAPELSEVDTADVWLNREVVTYANSSRQTWTGAATTDPTGATITKSITPGGFPIPARYMLIFVTEAGPVITSKWYEDLGSGSNIGLAGRSFAVRDFYPV